MQFKLFVAPFLLALVAAIPTMEPGSLAKRTCGTLTGEKLKICQDACKAVCEASTAGLAKAACTKACDAGPLKREAEPGVGHEVCDAACDVTCNSTVLALAQKKCLADCKAKC
ncbi:hypothetical protein BBP40_008905 [Aspergillus hancockii]|nr:hypothetical protein BBP40_008905 [Aspergillus hancockii]